MGYSRLQLHLKCYFNVIGPELDSRFIMMYKVTHDLVAIPASDYLTPNLRQSRHIHLLAFVQIPTLKDYYKYIFPPEL